MRTCWNDQEEGLLQGLPWLAQLIYLRALRRFVDYRTGLVGASRGISYQSIREVLFVEPRQGRRVAGMPSLKEVRNALDLLIEAGLIRSVGTERKLLFFLQFADWDESAQKKEGRSGADQGQTNQGRQNHKEVNGIDYELGRSWAEVEEANQGTPPISDIRRVLLMSTDISRPQAGPAGPDGDGEAQGEQGRGRGAPVELCPHQQIIALYHDVLRPAGCPEVRTWNAQRQAMLRARWREHGDLDWWRGYFEFVAESRFLTGRARPRAEGEPPFVATLEWLVRPGNMAKVYEGFYHRG